MWRESENGDSLKPEAVEKSGDYVIVRRNFKLVPVTEEIPEHWTWEEWQMTKEQFEVYEPMQAKLVEQEDAILELADIIGGMLE